MFGKNINTKEISYTNKSKQNSIYGISDKNYIPIKENLNKNEILEYKKLAQEKLRFMEKRKRCAIKIQRIWRGYVSRRKFKKIK